MIPKDDIKLDTSAYDVGSLGYALALIGVRDAQAAGRTIEWRHRSYEAAGGWKPQLFPITELDRGTYSDYRVKPEPEVAEGTEYALYVPKCGQPDLKNAGNLVRRFSSRPAALDAARAFAGSVLIQEERITYHDGVEVSREEVRT